MNTNIIWKQIDNHTYRAYCNEVDIGDAYRNVEHGMWVVTIPMIKFKETGRYRWDVFELAQMKYDEK